MNTVRMYETPEQFAAMMGGRLSEMTGLQVSSKENDPLLLDVWFDAERPEQRAEISLHETYRVYWNTNDLNLAVDYLSGMVRATAYMQQLEAKMEAKLMAVDARYLYPAIREERQVLAYKSIDLLSEPFLPGLRMVFLEIKDNVVKMVNKALLETTPRLTEERVKRIAKANLRAEGWHEPQVSLPSLGRKSCTVDVYREYPYPIDYQFFMSELAAPRMPESYVISYTNRRMVMTLKASEPMDTPERARMLVRKSGFHAAVRRSTLVLPGPHSELLYWVHRGRAELL